jgi:hypothetical protein
VARTCRNHAITGRDPSTMIRMSDAVASPATGSGLDFLP